MSIDLASLGRRMAKGAAWMFVLRTGVRGLGFISTIILARLLVPEDFGLVAMASVIVVVLEALGEFGFDLALIRNQKADRPHYDTAWTFIVMRGAVVAAVLALVAETAAAFFGDVRLTTILYIFAFLSLIEGFQNIGIVNFRKKLRFRKEFYFQFSQKAISFVVTISLAFFWRDYWALVAGIAAGKIGGVVLSYVMNSYRPRFSLAEWRDLFHFSKWILLARLVGSIATRADQFIVGKLLGPSVLGVYKMGYEISHITTGQLTWPITSAIYPGLAKLGDRRDDLVIAFLGSLSLVGLIAIPSSVGIALTAELLVKVLLGTKWLAAIPLIEILALTGALRVVRSTAPPVFFTIGQPRVVFSVSALDLLVGTPMLLVGALQGGAYGLCLAYLAKTALLMVATLYWLWRLLDLSPLRALNAMWRTIAASAVMAVWLIWLQSVWPAADAVLDLIVQTLLVVLSGMLIYCVANLLLWRLLGQPAGAEAHVVAFAKAKLAALFAARSIS